MDSEHVENLFGEWFSANLGDDFVWFLEHKPLLAHYTSIAAAESILKSEQVWFSHPLLMNDIQEMQHGITMALSLFIEDRDVKQWCRSPQIYKAIERMLGEYYNEFYRNEALDVYVFCVSEHKPKDNDGLLSMWRGYGGQGSGAALVFNSGFVDPTRESPLIISRVTYSSGEERISSMQDRIKSWCELLQSADIPEGHLHIAVGHLFRHIVLAALTTKHCGFSEEREWRLIYLPHMDPDKLLTKYFDYLISDRGAEPKLKLPIRPIGENRAVNWNLSTILERIILGPTASSPLVHSSILRMLNKIGKAELEQRVFRSGIPLRPAR